jgi:hypothetical protein
LPTALAGGHWITGVVPDALVETTRSPLQQSQHARLERRASSCTVPTRPPFPTTSIVQPSPQSGSGSAPLAADLSRTAAMATTLTELSAVISWFHAIRQRHPDQQPLHERLAAAVAGFEALLHLLLITEDGDPADETTPAVERPRRVEADFLLWLSGSRADRPPFAEPGDPEAAIMRLLVSLSSSRRRLPRASAAALGLPASACVGQAVTGMLLRVSGEAGHRPSSFGSGVRLPRDHDVRLAPRSDP